MVASMQLGNEQHTPWGVVPEIVGMVMTTRLLMSRRASIHVPDEEGVAGEAID
jgi:hypothetical protein